MNRQIFSRQVGRQVGIFLFDQLACKLKLSVLSRAIIFILKLQSQISLMLAGIAYMRPQVSRQRYFQRHITYQRNRNPGQLEVWGSAPGKLACFGLFGLGTPLLLKIIEDSEEILFMWVMFIDIYYIKNEIISNI